MPNETIHVGVQTVLCTATFVVKENGTIHVDLLDGVREFELEEAEVDRLYVAIREQRRILGKER